FDMNTRLSELSWAIADGRIGFEDAHAEMADIVEGDSQNEWLVLLLASVANASFCRLFGGDAVAMVVVFIATLAGYYLKQILLDKGWDVRAVFMACSFVSSVLGATGILFSLGNTPFIALGTSVLYLVPGIPLLNSFSDMLYRHYVCAFSRFVDAVVLTCCLSIGLCGGMMFMNVGMF
ncbi:threonine/serine exporter family protein, partial [uncultured Duncaniella sp.]